MLNFAYEANALPSNCANERLVLATVADGFSCGVDAAGQCRIRHDPAAPDRRDEVILGNDAAAVLNQIDQEVEYLRLDGDALRTTAQFPPISVKCMIGKRKNHVIASGADHLLKELSS